MIGIACLLGIAGAVGLVVSLWRARASESRPLDRTQQIGLIVLFVTCLAAYGAVIQFGLSFRLTQARYFFPAINAVAIIVAVGWRFLLPVRAHRCGQAVIFAGVVVLNVVIFTQYVIPYWYLAS